MKNSMNSMNLINSNKGKSRIKLLKFFVIVLCFSLAFLISACGSSNTPTPVHYQNFNTGTKGITMNFVKGLPPTEVYQGTDFDLALEVRNEGAWDTNDLKVTLGGFNPKMVNIKMDKDPDSNMELANDDLLMRFNSPPPFEGRSLSGTRGGYKLITATAKKVMPPDIGDTYDLNLVATACYGYKTEASVDICIDPQKDEPGVSQQKKTCVAKSSYKLSGGQGSPVAITKIDYEMVSIGATKRTVRMKLYLDNLGKGNVYEQHQYYKLCSALGDSIQDTDFGVVNVVASMSGQEIDCNPFNSDKDFNLKLGKSEDNFVMCEFNIPEESFSTYNSILTIKAAFGYVDAISTKVKVKKLYGPGAEATAPLDSGSSSGSSSSNLVGGCCVKKLICSELGQPDDGDGKCTDSGFYSTPVSTVDGKKCCISKTKVPSCSGAVAQCNDADPGCGDTSNYYSVPNQEISGC